ncbi:MAG: hypothetical protein HQK51_21575, partial [Oligoflexia bacterium]|nr:hypothetical protein [Oligoflexia bacterium]
MNNYKTKYFPMKTILSLIILLAAIVSIVSCAPTPKDLDLLSDPPTKVSANNNGINGNGNGSGSTNENDVSGIKDLNTNEDVDKKSELFSFFLWPQKEDLSNLNANGQKQLIDKLKESEVLQQEISTLEGKL